MALGLLDFSSWQSIRRIPIRLISFLLILLTISSSAFADRPAPYFFEIRKAGKVSWILGTIHDGVGLRDVHSGVPLKIESSRRVFVEWVTDPQRAHDWVSDPVRAMMTHPLIRPSAGTPLMNEEREFLKAMGLPAERVETFTTKSCPEALGTMMEVQRTPMMDIEVQLVARSSARELRQLDTDALLKRADLLDVSNNDLLFSDPFSSECDLSASIRVQALRYWLASEDVINAYKQGKIAAKKHAGSELRTRAWFKTLNPEFARGGVFVAVGLYHVLGENGLLRMLERQGYSTIQLADEAAK